MEMKGITKILNDLVQINNDRIQTYEHAIEELKDENADLKVVFTRMISNSLQYKIVLAKELPAIADYMNTGSAKTDRFFRAWMNVKTVFSGYDRKTILKACELCEDAALRAYETALRDDNISLNIRFLISEQKQSLEVSHNTIKLLCDSQVHIMMLGYI